VWNLKRGSLNSSSSRCWRSVCWSVLLLSILSLSSGCLSSGTITVKLDPPTLKEVKRLNDNVEALRQEMSQLGSTVEEAAKLAFPDEYQGSEDSAGR